MGLPSILFIVKFKAADTFVTPEGWVCAPVKTVSASAVKSFIVKGLRGKLCGKWPLKGTKIPQIPFVYFVFFVAARDLFAAPFR